MSWADPDTPEAAIHARSSYCQDCGAPIFWARTPGYRNAAFDVAPHPQGRYYVAYWTDRYIHMGSVAVDGLPNPDEPRYDTHLCPRIARRRKPRGRAA